MRRLAVLLLIAACAPDQPEPPDDVVGPFTGPIHRFVVDGFRLPATNDEANALADDLDGDEVPENRLGGITAALAMFDNLTVHAPDMIASGVLASTVEIQADDLANDPTVAVRYLGRDDAAATRVGGTLAAGVFRSNRTRHTQVPGDAVAALPIFIDSDPTEVRLVGVQIDLVADGRGGFDATVCGAIADAEASAHDGLFRMIEAHPQAHPILGRLIDRDGDGLVTLDEVADNNIVEGLVVLDLARTDGDAMSACFAMHLAPCPSGRCAGTPVDLCHDRILDGVEVGVDCGGSCLACPAGATCLAPSDCQTGACTGNTCAPATCSDGVLDGFESDVDCGANCDDCQNGQRCITDDDCRSHLCVGTEIGACSPS